MKSPSRPPTATNRSSYITMTPSWPSMPQFMHRAASPPPASSVYSPTHMTHNHTGNAGNANAQSRSAALRPWSQLFSRFTPRLGAQRTGDAEAGHVHDSLYDSSARHRSTASTHLPPQNPFADPASHPAMPFHPGTGLEHDAIQSPAAARAGPDHIGAGLPVTFTTDEIAQPPNAAADGQTAKQQRAKHQHRHKKPSHRRARHASPLPPGYKPKSALKDPAVKIKLLHTAISGFLFLVILIIFLAISPTTPVFSAPFRVVNSLFIIIFAILFVHCCIRLNTLIRAARRRQRRIARKNAKADGALVGSFDSTFASVDHTTMPAAAQAGTGPGVHRAPYFDDPEIGLPPPGEPFRVVLARDEELGLTDDVQPAGHAHAHDYLHHHDNTEHPENEVLDDDHRPVHANSAAAAAAGQMRDVEEWEDDSDGSHRQGYRSRPAGVKLPPPVYGVWRGSVRADPNLLHWQRVPGAVAASSVDADSEEEGGLGGRDGVSGKKNPPPPSYRTEEERRGGLGHGQGLPMLPSTRYLI